MLSDLPPPPPRWRSYLPAWVRGIFWVDEADRFDAFLSYSWSADSKEAPLIQSVLQQFLRPWYKPRARRIFRDLSSLPANSNLADSLKQRLDKSEHLIVLASPEAKMSDGMEFEADYWLSRQRDGQIVVVVTSGAYAGWSEIRNGALPPSLENHLVAPPLWIDVSRRRVEILREPTTQRLRERLTEDLKQLLLCFYPGKDWGELRGQERSQRRRALVLVWAVALSLAGLTGIAGWQALVAHKERDEAIHQAEVALARQLGAQSELLRTQSPTNLPLAVRLASEAIVRDPSAEADQVLWRGLVLLPTLMTELEHEGELSRVRYTPDGCCVLTASVDGKARMIDVKTSSIIGQVRHKGPVWDVGIDSNGKIVATASADGTARISEWGTGKTLFILKHAKGVRRVLFSPNGKLLATGSEDGTGRLWDVHSGREVARLIHSSTVWDLAFSPDGRYFATGGRDDKVRVWDCERSRQVADLAAESMVWSLSFSSDGTLLAAGTDSGLVSVWRTGNFKPAAELNNGDRVLAIGFDPDGQGLVTTSFDGTIRLWSARDFHEVRRMLGQEQIVSLAFSQDGKLIATGGKAAEVWELSTGKERSVMAPDNLSSGIAFSPSGEYLATASDNKFLRIWRLSSGERALLRNPDHDPSMSAPAVTEGWTMSFDKSGHCLVTGGGSGVAAVFQTSNGAKIGEVKNGPAILSTAATENCQAVATGGKDGLIRIWNLGAKSPHATLTHHGPVFTLSFNDDGTSLISASDDHTARVWDVASGRQVQSFLHADSVHAAFLLDANGRTALTISPGGSSVWNLDSGARFAILDGLDNVLSAAVSQDGREFAMGNDGGDVKIWDASGRLLSSLRTGHEVWSIAITEDNQFLATAPLRSREATIWSIITGKATIQLESPANVSAVAFEPTGRFLATGTVDGSVRVWDISGRRAIAEYQGPSQNTVTNLRFTRDGMRLAIGFENGFTELIPWAPNESLDIACSRLRGALFSRAFRDYVGARFAERACQ
jgi:WD40 repeat protein